MITMVELTDDMLLMILYYRLASGKIRTTVGIYPRSGTPYCVCIPHSVSDELCRRMTQLVIRPFHRFPPPCRNRAVLHTVLHGWYGNLRKNIE